MNSLRSRTFNGIKWNAASTIVNAIAQIGYTAIMARLLEPAAFGLVAMAHVVLRFGSYFANMGMAQALIQKKEITEKDIRSAFTSSIVLGVFFFLVIYFLAPFSKLIFDSEEVIPIIKFLAISFIFNSLATTSSSLLRRKLDFKPLAIIQIISFIFYALLGIYLAYQGLGVWSLVYSSLANTVLIAFLNYAVVRHSVIPYFKWKVYKPLLAFGGKISVTSFLEFFTSNIPIMLIGRFLGASPLGIYNRALMLVELPINYLNSSISKVLFPAFSSIQDHREKLKKVFLSSSSVIAFLILGICAGISASSENIVLSVLGEEWSEAIPVLTILSIVVGLRFLSHYGGIICDATATLNVKIYLKTVQIVLLLVVLYLIKDQGLVAFAAVILISETLVFIAYSFITRGILKFSAKEYINTYFPPFLSALLIGVVLFVANLILDLLDLVVYIKLVIDMIIGAAFMWLILVRAKINKAIFQELYSKGLSQIGIFKRLKYFKLKFQGQ